MAPLNPKVLPFAIAALIFSYLTFATAISLTTQIEIMLSLEQVLVFFLILTINISLMALSISIVLSQVKDLLYRIALFFLLFLPYASVFILKFAVDPIVMLAIFVLFIGMGITILMEFNRLYSNQIKTYIETPARANAKTIIFFIALSTALVFFSTNNNPESEKIMGNKILDQTTSAITTAIEDYGLIEKMVPEIKTGEIGQPSLSQAAKNKMQAQTNKLIEEQITAMITPYQPYIIYILTILIFGTIAGISTFVGIFTTLLGLILMRLLKSGGYVKEIKQTVEVTRITL